MIRKNHPYVDKDITHRKKRAREDISRSNTDLNPKLSGTEKQSWETMFSLLEQYKRREGNYRDHGRSLSAWLHNQRQRQKNRTLKNWQADRLIKLGINLNTVSPDDRWERMYYLLEKFKRREGHCNMPIKHEEEGKKLGLWLHNQKQRKKRGQLKGSRVCRLESLVIADD